MTSSAHSIVWFAFASSQLMFAAVGWFVWPGLDPSNALVIWSIAAMVAPLSVASVVGPGLLIGGDAPEQVRMRSMLRWAFAESVTLVGLVATSQGGPRWLVLACAVWALVLLVLAYPSDLTDGRTSAQ